MSFFLSKSHPGVVELCFVSESSLRAKSAVQANKLHAAEFAQLANSGVYQ